MWSFPGTPGNGAKTSPFLPIKRKGAYTATSCYIEQETVISLEPAAAVHVAPGEETTFAE